MSTNEKNGMMSFVLGCLFGYLFWFILLPLFREQDQRIESLEKQVEKLNANDYKLLEFTHIDRSSE